MGAGPSRIRPPQVRCLYGRHSCGRLPHTFGRANVSCECSRSHDYRGSLRVADRTRRIAADHFTISVPRPTFRLSRVRESSREPRQTEAKQPGRKGQSVLANREDPCIACARSPSGMNAGIGRSIVASALGSLTSKPSRLAAWHCHVCVASEVLPHGDPCHDAHGRATLSARALCARGERP
jgi:hypothetical protein